MQEPNNKGQHCGHFKKTIPEENGPVIERWLYLDKSPHCPLCTAVRYWAEVLQGLRRVPPSSWQAEPDLSSESPRSAEAPTLQLTSSHQSCLAKIPAFLRVSPSSWQAHPDLSVGKKKGQLRLPSSSKKKAMQTCLAREKTGPLRLFNRQTHADLSGCRDDSTANAPTLQ